MATVSAPNRTVIAILFLVGGALQIFGAIVGLANAGNAGAIYAISNIAIGVGFALMMAWLAGTTVARVAYFIAALGWLLLALTSLVNLGVVGTFAVFIAIVGTVFAAIIEIMARAFSGQADILFMSGLLAGAVNLLLTQVGGVPAVIIALFVVAFGVLLVLASIVILRGRLLRAR